MGSGHLHIHSETTIVASDSVSANPREAQCRVSDGEGHDERDQRDGGGRAEGQRSTSVQQTHDRPFFDIRRTCYIVLG